MIEAMLNHGDVIEIFDPDSRTHRRVRVLRIEEAGPKWFDLEVMDLELHRRMYVTRHKNTIKVLERCTDE